MYTHTHIKMWSFCSFQLGLYNFKPIIYCVNLSGACNSEITVIGLTCNFVMCTIPIINYYIKAYYFIHVIYYYF